MAAQQERTLKKNTTPEIFALWTAFEFVHTLVYKIMLFLQGKK